MKHTCVLAAAGLIPAASAGAQAPKATISQTRPNIVFLMAEDLSTESFALYNGHGAHAPNLERMAAHGIVFNNAYSCAPVSSAARSSLFTGCYAPSMGLSWHRKLEPVTLPEDIHIFPWYLQQAGYHTTNVQKTDYNFVGNEDGWDNVKARIGAWRKRPSEDTPFFHCITVTACHESSLQFPAADMDTVKTMHDPAKVVLHPQHQDTPLMRYTYARHYDAIYKVDQVLGDVLSMLEEDGLLDNTFVFYFGDNGGCTPGTKAYTNDYGLHVPMVAYVPERFKDLAPYKYGSRCDALVSFLDLGPTLINLAGAELPKHLDGEPLLGRNVGTTDLDSKDVVFNYGDRFDETYAMNRVVRKVDYQYSRNFYPYQAKWLYAYYRLKQPAFAEMLDLHNRGGLNEVQDRFFRKQGAEELYLLSSDPFETASLVADPEYGQVLERMRKILDEKMISEIDLGVIPEALWLDHVKDLESYKATIRDRYAGYLETANLARYPYADVEKRLKKALAGKDEIVRYWALVACCGYGSEALPLLPLVRKIASRDSGLNMSKAAMFLAITTGENPSPKFDECVAVSRNQGEWLMVLNDAAFVKWECPQIKLAITPTPELNNTYGRERLKYLNGNRPLFE